MKSPKIRILVLILILSLFATVTTIVSAQNGTEQTQATAHIKFAHLAPFADDATNTEVTVHVGASIEFTFMYEDIHPFHPDDVPPPQTYMDIEPGTYLVEVFPNGSTTAVISKEITIADGSWNSVAVIGNGTNQPFDLLPLIDRNPGTTSSTHSLVRFAHVAPFAANLDDTRVDICDNGQIWMGLANVPYKGFTDYYMEVTQGEYYLSVTDAGSNCATVFYNFPGLYFKNGQVADLYVIGDGVNQPLDHATGTGLLYIIPSPEGYWRIGHFSQFFDPADISTSSVTIRVDGVNELTDFLFKDTTDYMALTIGDHLIEVLPTGTSTVVASSTITIEEDVYYTSGVIGDNDDKPIEIYTLVDETDRLENNAKLRIVHAAPIAPLDEDTKVDVCSALAIFEGLTMIEYKDYTDPYLVVDAGVFNLYIADPADNCNDILWSIEAFGLSDMAIADLWVLEDDSYCWGDCDPVGEPPMVNLAHVAPYENNYNLTPITIMIDHKPAIEHFAFLKFSGYKGMVAGTHYVEMIQESSSQILATAWMTLEGDMHYTLHMIGDGDNQPIEVWLLEDDVNPLGTGAKIRFAHVAPVGSTDASTLMDVCNAEDVLYDDLEELPYKYHSDPYLVFDSGYYRIKGVQSGKNCDDTIADYFVGLYPYLMEDGDISTIYLFGANFIPTGQISWPDISAYMVYLNIVIYGVNPIP